MSHECNFEVHKKCFFFYLDRIKYSPVGRKSLPATLLNIV